MSKYKFVGNGMGVPGLPHELTDEDAVELDVVALLEEAVKNGNYEVDPPVAGATSPQVGERNLEGKKAKRNEVNNG